MDIKIRISKEQARHLSSPHSFYDECEPACKVLRKVQKKIDSQIRGDKNVKV